MDVLRAPVAAVLPRRAVLALFRESDEAAAQALTRLGASESQVRSAVTALLADSFG